MRLILDLCGGSGAWSAPYREAGYQVEVVDLPSDVRLRAFEDYPVHGILAAPPCTVFASSGARWVRSQADVLAALSVVDACLRLIALHRPRWWALENPVGRLTRFLGPPVMYFDPCDYGERHTKRTALWGRFTPPFKHRVAVTGPNPIHHMAPSADRAARRAITPAGFARAFFEANP